MFCFISDCHHSKKICLPSQLPIMLLCIIYLVYIAEIFYLKDRVNKLYYSSALESLCQYDSIICECSKNLTLYGANALILGQQRPLYWIIWIHRLYIRLVTCFMLYMLLLFSYLNSLICFDFPFLSIVCTHCITHYHSNDIMFSSFKAIYTRYIWCQPTLINYITTYDFYQTGNGG